MQRFVQYGSLDALPHSVRFCFTEFIGGHLMHIKTELNQKLNFR